MKNRKIITIDGGSAEYWRQRTHGFHLIREAERAAEHLASAPLYIAGAWDEDYGDYEPVENLAPFDRMEQSIRDIAADDTAVSILVAQRRTHIGGYEISVVSDALMPDEFAEDPARNPLWGLTPIDHRTRGGCGLLSSCVVG